MTHDDASSLSPRAALPPRSRRIALRLLPALLALASTAAAQSMDFLILKLEVNQSVSVGNATLSGGRPTWVRAYVRVLNPAAPTNPVDGLLRIYVDGVETADSPVFSVNGPFPAKQQIDPSDKDGTLNFAFLAPTSSNVVLKVEVNPPGPNHVDELSSLNNELSSSALNFKERVPGELAYVPIDYRPGGGTIPNLPPLDLIEPGTGDNFVEGIYPVSDWYYHRTDAPSKLWTGSLAGSGSDLLNSLSVDIQLMSPVPDFLYGWVNGGLPYNGQSVIGGQVCMGNTELIRFQRTLAHELGHCFGLQHNSLTTNLIGVDVEHQLNVTQALPQIKPSTLKDIMYAGLLTQDAWVAQPSYEVFYNHFVFAPGSAADSAAPPAPRLMITGTWNRSTGALTASDVLTLPDARPTPAAAGPADLVLRAYAGSTLLSELPLAIGDTTDSCRDADSASSSPVAGFSAVLAPAGGGAVVDRVVVAQAGSTRAFPLELQRSASAPVVEFSAPTAALGGPALHVSWSASDADGDALHFYLRYSPDGSRFVPLATGIAETQWDVDLAQLPRFVAGHGFFELLASDGLNTTVTRTGALQRTPSYAEGASAEAPWVYIMTPDPHYSFLRGATIVLHGSGWDLEDNGLNGDSLVWTSDLDGQIGTGRLAKTSTLSVGVHTITLTGTDSDGMTSTDTATITIVDRGLPDTTTLTCQPDIGFQGPGLSVLTMCGGDLSTGTSAYIQLLNGPPLAASLLFVGFTSTPTPFKGGMLVPVPVAGSLGLVTDAAGEFLIPDVPGGGGPLTLYLQVASADAGQPHGVSLSNAVQAQFLP
ncbi:MAG TPA: hypothetical protein VFY71_01095 [Planctomycetota bacterium]|nr:hypothetical protein [Planctomycetota bacterium]